MYIKKLSLYIISLNEEERLPKVLDSVKGVVDEILIVDSGSTDRTKEIAESYGARFVFHKWESVGHQVKWSEEQCSYDWVLRLDADEVLSSELAAEILRVRENGAKDGYYVKIYDMVIGRNRPNPLVKNRKIIRLYNRTAYAMTGRLGHDDVEPVKDGATASILSAPLLHYTFLSIHQMVDKHNVETDRLVERAMIQGKNYSPLRIVGTMTFNFLKMFFIDRYFLYGFWGFILSVDYAFFRFLKFSKFYEQKQLERHSYFRRKPFSTRRP
ncbi:MAG: glycosyltransferase family 2 protein [Synergistaceae bacterium]|jgi:glycosyltransferase involved in cell wall biosynthesis|nr:glycosyltransferase family 2 protein [Synergistaceae bacterium]